MRRKVTIEEYRADYFRCQPTKHVEQQINGCEEEENSPPVIQHQLPERAELADLLCQNHTPILPEAVTKRRILSASLMQKLCSRREVSLRHRLRPAESAKLPMAKGPAHTKPSPPAYPLVLEPTQCPICVGDISKTYEAPMGCFCRRSKMWDHVDRQHFKHIDPANTTSCYHP